MGMDEYYDDMERENGEVGSYYAVIYVFILSLTSLLSLITVFTATIQNKRIFFHHSKK